MTNETPAAKPIDFRAALPNKRPCAITSEAACRICGGDDPTLGAPDGLCRNCRALERAKEDWLRASGITPRHDRFRTWPDLHGPEPYMRAVERVRKFLGVSGSIVALIGNCGTGKTQLACVAVRAAIAASREARIVTCVALLADLKGRYGGDGAADSEWLTNWARRWLLVIDEFGIRLDTDWARVMLPTLLDQRYATMRPTILIGNVTREQFVDTAGPSVVDRCNEDGGVIVCDWPSFRQAKVARDDGV